MMISVNKLRDVANTILQVFSNAMSKQSAVRNWNFYTMKSMRRATKNVSFVHLWLDLLPWQPYC